MDKMLKLGPKEMKGLTWDEAGKSEIVQILISHEEDTIKSIQFAYVVNNKVCLSEMHGEPTGSNFDVVTFEHPFEYLVSVRGEYDLEDILVLVAFETNKREYGPLGGDDSVSEYEKFKYNFGFRSSFAGFHGSVDKPCVHAIGVYVKPLESLSEIKCEHGTANDSDTASDGDAASDGDSSDSE